MILCLTPLRLEHEALCAALGELDGERPRPLDFEGVSAFAHGRDLTTAIGGHGKVQFALTTSFLSERVRPRLIVCAGACGGLAPELRVGDVVVAETTLEHDYNLRFVKRPLPAFPGDPAALADLRARHGGPAVGASACAVHFGAIASGDEDVMEPLRGEQIRALTGALAVAWEGAGGARAARFHKRPFLEVRAVTDRAGGAAAAEFAQNLPRAMAHLAQILGQLRRSLAKPVA